MARPQADLVAGFAPLLGSGARAIAAQVEEMHQAIAGTAFESPTMEPSLTSTLVSMERLLVVGLWDFCGIF